MANFNYKKYLAEGKLHEDESSILTPDQVERIAQQVADKFSSTDDLDIKYAITPGSAEADPKGKGAGFDLDAIAGPNTPGGDWKDENGFDIENYLGKYAGGSFYIKMENGKHNIYNAAAQNAYVGHVTPQGEVVFEIPGFEGTMDQLNFLEEEKSNKQKLIDAGYSESDAEDFADEFEQGGVKVPQKVKDILSEEKPKTKMKKSELKEMIKAAIMAEAELNVNTTAQNPENEEDFLAEIEAILAEADEFETAKPARITSFLKALDLLVYDEYHSELYDSDEVKQAYDLLVKAVKKLGNLNEADEEVDAEAEVAVDDTEVEDTETIDVKTTAEVDPNVKAVQDSLTQAQAAAKALGDAKLTDQIGNTITFFTRTHVASVDKDVAEAVIDAASGDEGAEDVTSINPQSAAEIGMEENLNESMFPMLKKILK
jgi:hypothetical protein